MRESSSSDQAISPSHQAADGKRQCVFSMNPRSNSPTNGRKVPMKYPKADASALHTTGGWPHVRPGAASKGRSGLWSPHGPLAIWSNELCRCRRMAPKLPHLLPLTPADPNRKPNDDRAEAGWRNARTTIPRRKPPGRIAPIPVVAHDLESQRCESLRNAPTQSGNAYSFFGA